MRKIKTALLSYGMSGEVFHGPLLEAHPHFAIEKVYHRNERKEVVHPYRTTNNLNEIFGDDNVELVIVNTPNELHFEHARQALLAGKHVVVEKPFTVTTTEADELIELARTRERVLTVFQNRRWDGDFLTVQKVLKEQLLGRVVEFESHYDRYRTVVEEHSWKESGGRGTGVLYNLGSHMLDQVLVLFGMPVSVSAKMGVQRDHGKSDDFYDLRLNYHDKTVIVKSSYLVRQPGARYTIHGTLGSFIKHGIDPQEQDLKEKKKPGGTAWGTEEQKWWGELNTSYNDLHIEGKIETIAGNYLSFYDNLYQAIAFGAALAVKPEESRDVIALIEAAIRSSRERQDTLLK